MLGYDKNYAILALNYVLKNLKWIILVLEIKRRNKYIKLLKELL